MTTTRALNSENTVWVTTYAGRGGRFYDISMKINEAEQVSRTFTEVELQMMLGEVGGKIHPLCQPDMVVE